MKLISKNFFTTIVVTALLSITFSMCKKSDSPPALPTVPTVTTAELSNISTSGATSGGTIVSDGGAAVTQSGIVWSKTNTTPTLADSVIEVGHTSIGPFTTNLTGLDFNAIYYIRAYATNSVGTGYGNVLTLNTVDDTTKVRFTYNGEEVVYGIMISPATGRKWLDRNLGAKRVAITFDDFEAYGDLFQWGRPTDGHQLVNWTASTTGMAINGMTNVLATSDIPGHNSFIDASTSSIRDWRDDGNANRWATFPQGPCPAGWHVPTYTEWEAEISEALGGTAPSGGITNSNTAYDFLKLPSAGYRRGNGPDAGKLRWASEAGYYWCATAIQSGTNSYGAYCSFFLNYVQMFYGPKAEGYCVRCIKD